MWLMGESEWALRFLSTCAGLLTVALVYVWARTAFGPRDGLWVGVVSAAIIALHPDSDLLLTGSTSVCAPHAWRCDGAAGARMVAATSGGAGDFASAGVAILRTVEACERRRCS